MPHEKEEHSKNKWIVAVPLFVISYLIVYALSLLSRLLVDPLQGTVLEQVIPALKWAEWVSPMYFLMPIVGFFFVYFAVEWAKEHFESGIPESIIFPPLFTVFFIAAFWIAVFFFHLPNALAGYPVNICFPSCFGATGGANLDYWHELKHSAFWLFYLAGLLGWASYGLKKKLAGIL